MKKFVLTIILFLIAMVAISFAQEGEKKEFSVDIDGRTDGIILYTFPTVRFTGTHNPFNTFNIITKNNLEELQEIDFVFVLKKNGKQFENFQTRLEIDKNIIGFPVNLTSLAFRATMDNDSANLYSLEIEARKKRKVIGKSSEFPLSFNFDLNPKVEIIESPTFAGIPIKFSVNAFGGESPIFFSTEIRSNSTSFRFTSQDKDPTVFVPVEGKYCIELEVSDKNLVKIKYNAILNVIDKNEARLELAPCE